MFDIAFSEIVVIGVVALVVIGPERLPKVARTLGHMFGRLQRYVNDVKADISREMELDELRKLKTEVQSAARDFVIIKVSNETVIVVHAQKQPFDYLRIGHIKLSAKVEAAAVRYLRPECGFLARL